MTECSLCGVNLELDEDEIGEGDVLSCDECGASMTVIGLNPLQIEEIEEDYDEEEEVEDSDKNGHDPWASFHGE